MDEALSGRDAAAGGAEQQRLRVIQPKRRGRPRPPVVTGYLIGDDSTMHKPKGKKHVLLDSWYCAKCLWRAARERDFQITTGIKSNRWLRVDAPTDPRGWRWQRLSDYAGQLEASDYVELSWPRGEGKVYVHVVTTRVRKLYRCQVVIVRHSLDAPLSQTRSWASSDLEADAQTLLSHIAAR